MVAGAVGTKEAGHDPKALASVMAAATRSPRYGRMIPLSWPKLVAGGWYPSRACASLCGPRDPRRAGEDTMPTSRSAPPVPGDLASNAGTSPSSASSETVPSRPPRAAPSLPPRPQTVSSIPRPASSSASVRAPHMVSRPPPLPPPIRRPATTSPPAPAAEPAAVMPPPAPSASASPPASPPPSPPAETPAKDEIAAKDEDAPAKEEVVAKAAEGLSAIVPPPLDAAPPEAAPDDAPEDSGDGLLEDAPPSAPPPPPVPSAPMLSLSDGGPTSAEPFPLIPTVRDVSPLSSRRREPTSVVLRAGLAFFLVALGFGIGRLTAPMPTASVQSIAHSPPASGETTPVTAAAMPPVAPPPAATVPPPTTAAAPATPSVSRDLVDQPNKPIATAATSSMPLAAPAAPVVPDLQATRRPGPPAARPVTSARSDEPESAAAAVPSATARPVNSFVQAVHDDIAEDEATHKKP